jgi:hypothetical protein
MEVAIEVQDTAIERRNAMLRKYTDRRTALAAAKRLTEASMLGNIRM